MKFHIKNDIIPLSYQPGEIMPTINTFEQFVSAYEDADYDFDSMSFTPEEQKAIKRSIMNFGKEPMENADRVIADYFGLKIPHAIIKEVLTEDFEMAYEVYTDGVRDTCQRDMFMDNILRHVDVRTWPMYGEGEDVMKNFFYQLKVKGTHFGIELLPATKEKAAEYGIVF